MNIFFKTPILAIAAFLAIGCANVDARGHYHHHCRHAAPVRVVVAHPAPAKKISHRFTKNDRLNMALGYLATHPYITAKQYAKLTSLKKDVAEAELDAFVIDRRIPILASLNGKKRVYVKAPGY